MNKLAHESILRTALKDEGVDAQALAWLVRANLDSDLHQFDARRHFDNARDVPALQDRWKKGLHTWFMEAVAAAAPSKFNRRRSLANFGRASHALADFYAHTDWVEIHAALGIADTLVPFTGSAFPLDRFPSQLSSGFFSLRYGLDGCPGKRGAFQPPLPYRHCHATIAKDYPDRDHGADLSPDCRTYFEIAVSCAVLSTRALWHEFQAKVTQAHGPAAFQHLALSH